MTRAELVRQIMFDFAERTGLVGAGRAPARYLWTDAFAVCNFLGLYVEHDDAEALDLARRLVDQTHHVLGRHRKDDPRRGWISGLSEAEGEVHPTAGGLRIGKGLPERAIGEPEDARREWDRDGQYFHYLTRWMHALDRLSAVTGERPPHVQACELARAAHAGFLRRGPDGRPHLSWKMSIDLSRPQVASMGLHDPLDGLLTCCALQAGSREGETYDLRGAIRDFASLCAGRPLDTDDCLGVGGLLFDALRVHRLAAASDLAAPGLLVALLRAARTGLESLVALRSFDGDPAHRLGFRELGLSIGLRAIERMHADERPIADPDASHLVERLARYVSLADRIEATWLEEHARGTRSWIAHHDINDVMLATTLAPDGYLGPPLDLESKRPAGR